MEWKNLDQLPSNRPKPMRWHYHWKGSISSPISVRYVQLPCNIESQCVLFGRLVSRQMQYRQRWLRMLDWPHRSYHHFQCEQHLYPYNCIPSVMACHTHGGILMPVRRETIAERQKEVSYLLRLFRLSFNWSASRRHVSTSMLVNS